VDATREADVPDDLESSRLRSEVEKKADEAEREEGDGPAYVKELPNDELVDRYENLVNSVAHGIYNRQTMDVPFEDVRAYGYEGLLEAQQNFDPDRGVAFSSFAYYRIRGAILDGFRDEGWSMRNQAFDVNDYVAVNDHMESHSESRAHLPRSKSFKDSIKHIDKMVGDTVTILLMRNYDLQDLQTTDESKQQDKVEKRERLDVLQDGLETLSDNEREVVIRYVYKDERMQDIADDMGYSKGWVSRIKARAIDKVRNYCQRRLEDL
jgi:RNA polymerase sigma factor for flagellar operon FliA